MAMLDKTKEAKICVADKELFFSFEEKKFMNRFRNLIGIFAFSLFILGLSSLASAQRRDDRDRDDDDGYYRNDDYRNNRDNRNNRNNRNLQATIKNLKNRSSQFERRLDRELDDSRYNDRNREDRINQLAEDFANAAENLDDAYDNRGDYNNSSNQAQRVLQLGNQLDRAISRARLNGNIQNDWSRIRQDLDVLANAYNYNNNNRNNRNNRRNRQGSNGDWRDSIPFPLPF